MIDNAMDVHVSIDANKIETVWNQPQMEVKMIRSAVIAALLLACGNSMAQQASGGADRNRDDRLRTEGMDTQRRIEEANRRRAEEAMAQQGRRPTPDEAARMLQSQIAERAAKGRGE